MIKRVTFIIRDYFGFSRSETRGLFLLLTCVSIGLVSMVYFEKTAFEPYQQREADLLILDSLMQKLEATKLLPQYKKVEVKRERFRFNPNHASLEDFLRLGIDEKLSKRIINFRSKGGRFYKAIDLMKIYDFPQSLFNALQPYIDIPQKEKIKTFTAENNQTAQLDRVEKAEIIAVEKERINYNLNEVDSLQLSLLKGIGPVLSSRIVKYRDNLGGFNSKNQLSEIYNISELALESLEEFAYVSEGFVPRQIKINEADFKTLLKHPYIDYALAKSIINHRRIYGNFSSPEELKEVYQMKEELLVKLLPYIVI